MMMKAVRRLFRLQPNSPNEFAVVLEAETLGARIIEARMQIIDELIKELRIAIPILKNDSRTYLIDHLPQVLEHIGEYLVSDGSRLEYLESAKLGEKHGEQRAFHSKYTVSDVRREYRLLRTRLLALVRPEETLSKEGFDLFSQVIETSLSHATEEFVRNSFSELKAVGVEKRRAAAELTEARAGERDEKQLRLQERANFSKLFQESPQFFAILGGPEFTFEFVNPAHMKMFAVGDSTGKTLAEARPELINGELHNRLRQVYQTGESIVLKDATAEVAGELYHFDLIYAPRFNPQGVIDGVYALGTDTTAQIQAAKNAETIQADGRKAAEHQQHWLEEVLNRLPEPLFFFDPKTGKSTFSNAAADRLLGMKYEGNRPVDLYGDRIASYHVDGTRMTVDEMPSSRAIRGEQLNGAEFILKAPTGVYHLRAFSQLMPAAFGHEETALLLIQDITELKAAESEAKNANAAKSQFLANMSHEIRTPLGAIMGFVSLLKDETLPRRELENYLSVVERNSTQLLRIIDDILDLSKVEAGMMLIEHINFSLPELMTDFSSLLGFKAREKGIGFFSHAVTPLPMIINSDPTRLRQILMNVVGNAVKFTDRGSVDLQVGYNGDGFLEFTVTDTGCGISAQQEKNLFQPFSQGDTSTTRKYGGTGLGLVLTRSLTETMGGTFELRESIIGKGSSFVVRVKIGVSPGVQFVTGLGFTTEPIRSAGVPGRLSDVRVLLVEDSPDNQALISIFLVRAGARVDIASDGEQGCAKALQENYDVVLMDVQMPIMDGITAIKKLRAHGYKTPVVALTAHAMKEERTRCLAAGFNDFLSKPVSREELVRLLLHLNNRSVSTEQVPQLSP